MRIAGNLAARTLDMLTENIKEGISTDYIDKLGYEYIRDNGGYSAPLYYRGFTKSLCTSLNHVVCHGIPSDRILREGDAINVDVTAIVDEHYGDTSRMFCIGKTQVKLNNLIDTTYESMMRAIKILKPGIKLGDIGYTIQSFVEEIKNLKKHNKEKRYLFSSIKPNYNKFEEKRYWRGPVWINCNWIIYQGLKNKDKKFADKIKETTINLIRKSGFYEYYSCKTGKAFGASNFSWTASLFLDLLLDKQQS